MMNTQGNRWRYRKCHKCCNQSKHGREALRASISTSEMARGSGESFLQEVVLELALKVKEIWMIEIAP